MAEEKQRKIEKELEPVLEEYTKLLFFPILLATLFVIAVQATDHAYALKLTGHGGLLIYLMVLIQRHRAQFSWEIVGILGAIAGAAVAFLSALYFLVTHFTVVAFFSVITDTAFAGILDGILAALLYILVQLKVKQKGGEKYGNS